MKTVFISSLVLLLASCASMKKNKDQPSDPSHQEDKTPSLTAPKVRRVWVPAKIEGDKYIDGHYMYVIEKTSTWSD